MRSLLGILSLVLFASAIAADQKDPKWMAKDYTSWTDEQAERVLLDSPWAQQVGAVIIVSNPDDPRDRQVPLPTAPGQPSQGPSYKSDGYGVDDGNWDGGVGRIRRGEPPTIPVTVRWDSALPIRAALLKTHAPELLDTENTLTQPEKNYIITVIGLVPAHKPTTASTNSEADDPGRFDVNHIRMGLMNASRLLLRDGRALTPEDVHFDEATGTLQIYFPKSTPISLEDKEVLFRTTFGSLKVARRFRLKDLTYKGKLEL